MARKRELAKHSAPLDLTGLEFTAKDIGRAYRDAESLSADLAKEPTIVGRGDIRELVAKNLNRILRARIEAKGERVYHIPNTGDTWFPREGYCIDGANLTGIVVCIRPIEQEEK